VSDPGHFGCGHFGTGRNCGYPTDIDASELAHMFYVTLGNTPLCMQPYSVCVPRVGGGLTNMAGFTNMPGRAFWSSALGGNIDGAWYFVVSGFQENSGSAALISAVAVRDGDVMSPVPESATCILMVAGLGMIGFYSRRRSRC